MAELMESGRVVELILVVLAAEGVVLWVLARLGRLRLPLAALLLNLGAGACLLLGMRAILGDSGWIVAGVWLGGAFFAHAGDLFLRWKA